MADGIDNPVSGLPQDSGQGRVPVTPPMAPAGASNPGTPPNITGTPGGNQPEIQVRQVPVIPPHVGRLAQIGHIASTLLGTQNQYSIDPKTGQTIATPMKEKPGDLFRHMVAGALMGGAAAEGTHDPTAGFVKGGAAVVQDSRQQDLLRRQQAKEQFTNQLEANREQREQEAFKGQQEFQKAQIAHMNVMTAHENQLIQGESFKQHEEQAVFGKNQMQPFLDAGIKPVYRDIPESQMHDMIKNSPGASTLYWEPTGTKTGFNADGTPTYELTYTAINPKGKVTVTQGVLDNWKKAGMDTYDPELFKVAKPGYEMDARDFLTTNGRAQTLMNTKLNNEKERASIDEINARKDKDLAEAAKFRAEKQNYLEGKNKAGAFNKALQKLNEVGDFDKLPAGDKLILGESGKDAMKGALDKYKIDKANFDDNAAAEDLKDYEFYNDLVKRSLGNKPSATATVPDEAKLQDRAEWLSTQFPSHLDAGAYVRNQVANKTITEAEGNEMMKRYALIQNKGAKKSVPVDANAPTGLETNVPTP